MPNLKCPNTEETEFDQNNTHCHACNTKLELSSIVRFKAPKKILASDLTISNSNGTKLQNIIDNKINKDYTFINNSQF